MPERYDPRDSWLPAAGLFVAGLALAVDLARPGGGLLGGGLWIPVVYAAVPVAVGLLAYVRTRAGTGRPVPPVALVGLAAWGVFGALAAVVVVLVVGLGRPPSAPPSAAFGLLTGLLTYLVPTGAFAGLYGAAGRRPRLRAAGLAAAAPVVATVVLGVLVRLSW